MSAKFVMILDPARCVACSACVVACKTENRVPDDCFRDWVVTETHGAYPNLSMENRSERCNHCQDAPCVDNCPTGASYHRADGTVQVDRAKCTGCKNCMIACPYDARYVHPRGYVDKCTFCEHIDGSTACANVCPTECITFGDASDVNSQVSTLLRLHQMKTLQPEQGTWPNVYYLQGKGGRS
jgi:Fe-S-cluster-containing dehydrogenase component